MNPSPTRETQRDVSILILLPACNKIAAVAI
jgi:hypothetical protein